MRCYIMIVVMAWASMLTAKPLEFRGQAFDLETGALLYSEHHWIERDESGAYLRSEVRYELPEGKPLAVKQVDFRSNPLLPTLRFDDFRTGVQIQLESSPDNATLKRLHQEELSVVRELRLSADENWIADAGFDRMMMRHWDQLLAGETLKFTFLTLGRGRTVELQCELVRADAERVQFRITAQAWLYRLLMEPIELTYDLAHKRLLEYSGLTNIPNAENGQPLPGNLKARIVYHYGSR